MFRIYLRSSRTNLLRCPVTLQHSRLQRIHSSSSYDLPKTAKSSEILKATDEKLPVKRPRRKSVGSEAAEGSDESPVKAKKVRRKSATLEGVENPDVVAVKPVIRRARKSASAESALDNQDESITQTPVKRKRGRSSKVELENEELEFESGQENLDQPEYNGRNEHNFIKVPPDLKQHFTYAHKLGSSMGDRTRINIVNKGLCDDILDRLKPSLSKHIGCDIIDINPGVGFWSSKIHDFLKPRTHLLMEPDAKKYLPYLQPLLDAEDSTYKHIPQSGTVWEHLRQVTTPDFLPHQVTLSPEDPKINEPNDTLLVIANLGHYPRKKYRGFDSISQLVMYQLLAAARSHALFHQYGLIRMLVWIPDGEKATWLVRHIAQMRKNAAEAQLTTKYIREIASSTEDNHRFVRDSEAALQSSIKVVSNMNRMGIKTPIHRQGSMEVEARKSLASGGHEVKTGDFDRFKRSWVAEWEELKQRKKEGTLEMHVKESEDDKARGVKRRRFYTYEYKRYSFLSTKIKMINIHGRLTDDLIDEYHRINKFQGELKKRDPDSVDIQSSRDELKAMIEAYDKRLDDLPLGARKIYGVRLDGARITTGYEKREVEPLKVYAEEFIPQHEMCLLDIQPQAIWPILRENYPKNYDVFEYIIGTMYANPIDTVYESLDALWPGALEYIIDECPSLTDPEKGGGFDLKHISVRSLTTEMLKEIMEAWMKWPFRPDRYELMNRSGSMVHDPDAMEEDSLDGP